MADPLIWSKIPLHLLYCVIEQTDDVPTLRNWSSTCSAFNPVARKELWGQITISRAGLLSAVTPEELESHQRSAQEQLRQDESKRVFKALQEPAMLSKFTPRPKAAALVRRLVLDFKFDWGWETDEPGVDWQGLDGTLGALMPQLSDLREIDHGGVLYLKHLAQITGLSGLKTLKLRETRAQAGCWVGRGEDQEIPYDVFDLSSVARLESLRCLHVSELKSGEGCGLGHALKSLSQLEELHISVQDGYNNHDGEPSRGSPLNDLLSSVYEVQNSATIDNEAVSGFPASLKRLALSDCHHTHINLPDCFTQKDHDLWKPPVQPLFKLVNLSVDFLDVLTLLDFLLRQRAPNVTHMSVPLCGPREVTSRNTVRREQLWWEVIWSFSNKLLELTVLNIWSGLSAEVAGLDWLEQPWATYNAPMRLCLAGKLKDKYEEGIDKCDDDLSKCIFGDHWKPGGNEWSQNLSHIRIDQLDLEGLYVDTIEDDDGEPYSPDHSEPSISGTLSSFTEGQIATAIAAQNLPKLRVIAVGEFRFWIEHFAGRTEGYKVWYLRRALDDFTQSEEIFNIMNKEDWDFLADRPQPLMPESFGIDEPRQFEEGQLRQGNYLVLSKRAAPVH